MGEIKVVAIINHFRHNQRLFKPRRLPRILTRNHNSLPKNALREQQETEDHAAAPPMSALVMQRTDPGDATPTERTRGVTLKPHIDALGVEAVAAFPQITVALAGGDIVQTYCAIRRSWVSPAKSESRRVPAPSERVGEETDEEDDDSRDG
ncbi:hypothetical protein EUGRSUZ_D01164 [Eucalyptus grandis]|uniref:Uncharacterized protein n=2 Tax=Eucalyptus grandis TaxID=71139 RepID=A0ACC3L5X1_EUCGR|nr:hypothetical protein EUGRSUZ_D01164 [Eucalyptus grandis]